jgi:ribonucleoside-diphosphate reductase alpha chain
VKKDLLLMKLNVLMRRRVLRFEIGFIFNKYTLGEECLQRLGFTPEQYNNFEWSLLEALGFTDDQIEAANDYICGTMMLEGAPLLRDEHLPVFDCANKCGPERPTLHSCTWPYPHDGRHPTILSAALFPKTINLPHEATVEEIADAYC